MTKLYENLPQFSILTYMAGEKLSCTAIPAKVALGMLDEAIPEQNVAVDQALPEIPKLPLPALPAFLHYEGYHDHGYHVFEINSDKYEESEANILAIQNAIAEIIGEEDVLLVYRNIEGKTAYLPHTSACEESLINSLCSRFGDQLVRIVFLNPSWFIKYSLEKAEHPLFSAESLEKLKFVEDIMEFGRLTGFPGEIKARY